MKKIFSLAASMMLCVTTTALAQNGGYKSAIFNADGTVTFQYRNDKAKEVQVDVQFAGKNPMKKDAKSGLWTATVGPAAPDMYPYCFVVDGLSVMDPMCDQYFPNEGFKNSLLEIPGGKTALFHDIRKVPHGKVEYIQYYSKAMGCVSNAIVYLPPKYDSDSQKKYPVFYLVSGTTDTEEVYYKVGRMNYILDNLLAEGKAKEMIIVLPYGNPTKVMPPAAPSFGGFGMGMGMGMMRDVFSDDLVQELMPYVDSHYRTLTDRDSRGIGGFSRGGNQGLGIGLRNLDKFSYLCSYSSFTSTDIPGVYDNPDETNKKIHLFWLGVGTDDFLYGNARDYMQHLDDHGIRSVKEYTTDKYGHTWMNAKYFLGKTLQLLFNPEASEAAMKNGQPTKQKTGQEAQFTASTMAQLFPRQVNSPEFGEGTVTFRINAPQANKVEFKSETVTKAMEKDGDGVWSIVMPYEENAVYTYCFVVDGTPVADPTNMYLSPDKGFKHSVLSALNNPANPKRKADMKYGKVTYDLNSMTATYTPSNASGKLPVIQVVPGKDDTMESWFKIAGANTIADQLISEGAAKPCIITTATTSGAKVIKADAYKTWAERQAALIQAIKNMK